jgi:NAD(P)-dependent dehydrogenase (short-subunit alcohol dehydrogenase family)
MRSASAYDEAKLSFTETGRRKMESIEDKVVLVTGSTDGIGKITARKLAELGATVIVHGRSRDKCESTVSAIRDRTGSEKTTYYVGDLSALSEVHRLARDIARDHPRLDVLINNAGVGPGDPSENGRRLSADGHELCFAVNYLAPFLLTHLLVPVLSHSAPSRIVNVGSAAQERIDFDDVMLDRGYEPWRAYARSKLAMTMFTFDMADRLEKQDVTVNCLHPGSLLDTKMVRESSATPMGSAESGAEVEVYVATDTGLQGKTGVYFDENRESRAHEQAYDPEAREKLRKIGQSLTGIGG